jgi:RNA polymerase sigma factor (sigma-70 family)
MKALNGGMNTAAAPEAATEPLAMTPPSVANDAFVAFYTATFPQLAGYVRGLVGEEQTARDLAQEALVRTYARWLKVQAPKPYAYLVATNLVRAEWRRRSRQAVAAPDPVADHEDALSVRDLVDRLPAKLRRAVLLHYFADLSVEQVARLVRRPTGTVKRHLHEARRLLLDALEDA